MHYRISKEPCGGKNGESFFYSITRIDAFTRKALGKKRRLSLNTNKPERARKLLKKIQFELQERTIENENEVMFSKFVEEFDSSERVRIKKGKINEKTHKGNLHYIEKFRKYLIQTFKSEHIYLSEIRPDHARKFLESLHGKLPGQTGERSYQYARNVMLRFFNLALCDDKIKENPFIKTQKITVTVKEPNPFTVEEIDYLISMIPTASYEYRTWRNGIGFDYNTTLRAIELRNIKLKDIHRESDGLLYVHLPKTKNGKSFNVPIVNDALNCYRMQLENLKSHFGKEFSDELPLFANYYGKVLSEATVSKWVLKAIRKYLPHLEGKKTWHCIRKTGGTEVEKRRGEKIASQVLNHSDEKVTRRHYLKKQEIDLHIHADALSQMPRLNSMKQKGHKEIVMLIPKELLLLTNQIN